LRRTLYRMFSHTSGVSAEECRVEEHEVPRKKKAGKRWKQKLSTRACDCDVGAA